MLVETDLCFETKRKKEKEKERSPDEAATATREIVVLVLSAEFCRRILLNTLITVTEPTTYRVVAEEAYPLPLIHVPIFARRSLARTNVDNERTLSLVQWVQYRRGLFSFLFFFFSLVFTSIVHVSNRLDSCVRFDTVREKSTGVLLETPKTRGVWYRSGVEDGGDGGKGTDSCDVQRLHNTETHRDKKPLPVCVFWRNRKRKKKKKSLKDHDRAIGVSTFVVLTPNFPRDGDF